MGKRRLRGLHDLLVNEREQLGCGRAQRQRALPPDERERSGIGENEREVLWRVPGARVWPDAIDDIDHADDAAELLLERETHAEAPLDLGRLDRIRTLAGVDQNRTAIGSHPGAVLDVLEHRRPRPDVDPTGHNQARPGLSDRNYSHSEIRVSVEPAKPSGKPSLH